MRILSLCVLLFVLAGCSGSGGGGGGSAGATGGIETSAIEIPDSNVLEIRTARLQKIAPQDLQKADELLKALQGIRSLEAQALIFDGETVPEYNERITEYGVYTQAQAMAAQSLEKNCARMVIANNPQTGALPALGETINFRRAIETVSACGIESSFDERKSITTQATSSEPPTIDLKISGGFRSDTKYVDDAYAGVAGLRSDRIQMTVMGRRLVTLEGSKEYRRFSGTRKIEAFDPKIGSILIEFNGEFLEAPGRDPRSVERSTIVYMNLNLGGKRYSSAFQFAGSLMPGQGELARFYLGDQELDPAMVNGLDLVTAIAKHLK